MELVEEGDAVAPEVGGDAGGARGFEGALGGVVFEGPAEGGVFGGVEGVGEDGGGGGEVRGGDGDGPLAGSVLCELAAVKFADVDEVCG